VIAIQGDAPIGVVACKCAGVASGGKSRHGRLAAPKARIDVIERHTHAQNSPCPCCEQLTVGEPGAYGGMGSIEFVPPGPGEMEPLASCQFDDDDGLPVIVDLFVWSDGESSGALVLEGRLFASEPISYET